MNTTLRLAWRNLWRHSRRTWLTVGAMIFCNGLLVFLMSFQFGSYSLMINGTLSVLTGHVQVQHPKYLNDPRMRYSLPAGITLAARLRETNNAEGVAARGAAFALASSEERSFGIQVLGVEPAYEGGVSILPGLVSAGRYLRDNSAHEIVVGAILARNLRVSVGDEVTLLGSGRDGSFAAGVATVVGIVESGLTNLDRSVAQIPLAYFQELFSMGDHVHYVVLKASSLGAVPELKARTTAALSDPDMVVLDWDELLPGLRQAIQADIGSSFAIYTVLVILVAFSVLNTQLMSVLERTREFGVMMALGLRPAELARLVFVETAAMSLLGLAIGIAIGWSVSAYFEANGIYIPGMEEAMQQYNLPGEFHPTVSWVSLLLGPCTVFIGGMLAAIYPALRLFRLQPVAAMRAV